MISWKQSAMRVSPRAFALVLGIGLVIISGCARTSTRSPAPSPGGADSSSVEPMTTGGQPGAAVANSALSPVLAALVDSAMLAASESDADAIDVLVAALSDADLESAKAALESAIISAQENGQPLPGLYLALAAVYGRKGLVERAYASVQEAELAAKAPGVSFSMAALYGRLTLLKPPEGSGAFSVVVSCAAPGASVFLDGKLVGAAPARLEALRPGKHEVLVRLTDHDDWVRVVEGRDGERLSLAAAPEPSPVALTVATEPAGAEIWLDGERVGLSPWTGMVRPGNRVVEARLERYIDGRREISLRLGEGGSSSLALVPRPTRLAVTSVPSGAIVGLDGQIVGRTPWEMKDPAPGTYDLIVVNDSATSKAAWRQTVTLRAGDQLDLSCDLSRLPAESETVYLTVFATDSLPVGARVSVDGRLVGTVPIVKQELTGLTHSFAIEADGYFRYDVDKRSVGSTNSFSLARIPEILFPASPGLPAGASVYIDGALVGTVPVPSHAVPLTKKSTLTYLVRVEAPGYRPFEVTWNAVDFTQAWGVSSIKLTPLTP